MVKVAVEVVQTVIALVAAQNKSFNRVEKGCIMIKVDKHSRNSELAQIAPYKEL